METNAISTKKYIIKYGVIFGILSIIHNVILYLTDNIIDTHWSFIIVSLTILFSVILYGIYAYKSANNSFLKLKEALKLGIGIILIGSMITYIWYFLLMNIIEPDMLNQLVEATREKMIRRDPDISPEEIHRNMKTSEKFSSSYMISAFGLISNLLFGFIPALIGGAIMHKKQNL
ncbi:DUF4199 domain-containing protein [Aquimarina sp. AU58]|uniref:DUF4199 domain-containing protein n=1 Tax=Aquimarina sp. AU58 TaxID=1874112 RepID=UPI000D6E26F4|nr:DUF4199 domain-containing protein [Aquimarina sp. AU58]